MDLRAQVRKYWPKLGRQLTCEGADKACKDEKTGQTSQSTVIVPYNSEQRQYYEKCGITVVELPPIGEIDDTAIFKLSRQPGILALAFDSIETPLPYVVPGGRFNEFYGWDSYFIARGLLQDSHIDLAAAVADHFAFEIRNYGKILNANRPYYLGRTQPPFLTDLAWQLHDLVSPNRFVNWIEAAIEEYHQVWMHAPRYDGETGLSTYAAQGRGIPPEVEEGHFSAIIDSLAKQYNLESDDLASKYNNGELEVPELDEFLRHDRAVRESGHDVSSRLLGECADLATIDLASLLYKYETDIARATAKYPQLGSTEEWNARADKRKENVLKYLWIGDRFADYNIKTKTYTSIVSPTNLWALWSGLATDEQAAKVVQIVIPQLEYAGGLSGTPKMDSKWQWDFPSGWAPHQLLAWEGLRQYKYEKDAVRLASKWLSTVEQGYKRSGAVFEKYNVTGVEDPQDVRAEYGNQGSKETGFGWTNASVAIGYDNFHQTR